LDDLTADELVLSKDDLMVVSWDFWKAAQKAALKAEK